MATKKSSPIKKSESSSVSKKKVAAKKSTVSSKKTIAPVKKSSVVKKEVKPISIEETNLITKSINGDVKSSKSNSRSVDILKDAIQTAKAKQALKSDDKKEVKNPEDEIQTKTTYSKTDLLKTKTPVDEIKEDSKKEYKTETDTPNIVKEENIIEEKIPAKEENVNEEKPVYKPNDLTLSDKKEDKDLEAINKKIEEIKSSINKVEDKKLTTTYSLPNKRLEGRNKKSPLPILIILFIVAVGVFFTVRVMSPKKDSEALITDTTQTNDVFANETISSNVLAYTTTNDVIEPAPSIDVVEDTIETNKTVTLEKPPVEPSPPKSPEPPVTTPTISTPAIVSGETKIYIIKWRDTLEIIAESELGDRRRWTTIYALNQDVIKNPDSYKFGDKINIPNNKKTLESMTDAEKRALYEDYMTVVASYQNAGKTQLAEQVKAVAKTIYPNY